MYQSGMHSCISIENINQNVVSVEGIRNKE